MYSVPTEIINDYCSGGATSSPCGMPRHYFIYVILSGAKNLYNCIVTLLAQGDNRVKNQRACKDIWGAIL